jgi:FkbM family methyltransferase
LPGGINCIEHRIRRERLMRTLRSERHRPQIFGWLAPRVAGLGVRVSERLSPPRPSLREWRQADGDKMMRLDYDLSADAIVLDVGGYEGQWASDIVARYGCRIHVFEPVRQYSLQIARRFERNPLITVHPFGLSVRDEHTHASLAADSTSHVHSRPGEDIVIELRGADTVFRELDIKRVDLMKLNIEGAEYALLDHLIETGLIHQISDLQVQFHDIGVDSTEKVARLRARLAATHDPTFVFDFVWENWRRRSPMPTAT